MATGPVPTVADDCSVRDSDHDGVSDCYDKCPGTAKGQKVDEYGCPIRLPQDSPKLKLENSFPWPVPRPTTWKKLDPELFEKNGTIDTIGDLVNSINKALESAGYGDRSYYSVPGGLAIATRLEQIDDTGASKPPPDRFSLKYSMQPFTPKEIIKQMILAPEGHWRSVVFIVTPKPLKISGEPLTEPQARELAREGTSKPDPSVVKKAYTKQIDVIALIYQFDKRRYEKIGHFVDNSPIDTNTHLAKSNILQGFN